MALANKNVRRVVGGALIAGAFAIGGTGIATATAGVAEAASGYQPKASPSLKPSNYHGPIARIMDKPVPPAGGGPGPSSGGGLPVLVLPTN